MAYLDSVEVKKAGVEEAARASFGALLGWKSTIRLRPTVHPSATLSPPAISAAVPFPRGPALRYVRLKLWTRVGGVSL